MKKYYPTVSELAYWGKLKRRSTISLVLMVVSSALLLFFAFTSDALAPLVLMGVVKILAMGLACYDIRKLNWWYYRMEPLWEDPARPDLREDDENEAD